MPNYNNLRYLQTTYGYWYFTEVKIEADLEEVNYLYDIC